MIEVQITGLEEVRVTLNKLSKDLESNTSLNREISTTLAGKASIMAPRLTGALASSVGGNATENKATIYAGSETVVYAGVQEYGWPEKNIKAQPYLRPAVYNNMGYIIEKYNNAIETAIKKYNLD